MAAEIKQYKGRYTGPQIDDLLGRVPTIEQRVSLIESSKSDVNIEMDYTVPSNRWTCNHNLGKKPSVTVVDGSGNMILADVQHVNENYLIVSFDMNATGRIILN